MNLCKGVEQVETFRVKVTVQRTFSEIALPLLRYLCYGLLCSTFCLTFFFLIIGVYLLLRAQCYLPPELELRTVTVHNMTVTLTPNTTANTQTRELNYSMNITPAIHNPNTLPGCSIKYRLMVNSTAYRGDIFQQSYIPLSFSQQRGNTREVAAPMQGEHLQLNQTNAVFFEGEVQNRNVLMEVYVDTRFRTSERKTKSSYVKCQVIVNTPSPSEALGNMMYHSCSVMF